MAVPGYQDFMYPFLNQMKDGKEYKLQEIYVLLAKHFRLTDDDITELLPSGKQTLLHNRIGWARTYLSKAGLIKVLRRAVFNITDEGLKVLADTSVNRIDNKYLSRYQSFNQFINKNVDKPNTDVVENNRTPWEIIEQNYNILKNELQDMILEKILECSPAFLSD